MRISGNARCMRSLFAAAGGGGSGGGGGSVLPSRHPLRGGALAPPTSLRPLRATGSGLAESLDASSEVAAGLHTTAAAANGSVPPGLLEPQLTWPARTHGCGAVAADDVGGAVTVCGWVDRYRNLGGIIFLDIRDHTGIVQVVVDPQLQPEVAAKAERLRAEYVVAVSGALRLRQDPNPRLKTGLLEISPTEIKASPPL